MAGLISATVDFQVLVQNFFAKVETGGDSHDMRLGVAVDYYRLNSTRLIKTFNAIAPYIDKGSTVLELGGLSIFGHFLRGKGCSVHGVKTQSHDEIEELGLDSIDAVLCFDVLQGLSIQEDREISEDVYFPSAKGIVGDMYRVLKPGGVIICTARNAASYLAMARIASGLPPTVDRAHLGDYTVKELTDLFEDAGFTVDSLETPTGISPLNSDLDLEAAKVHVQAVNGPLDFREPYIVGSFKKPYS
ncbi:methyltransferase domain-containing protein [Oryzifoliimicrobium ureilyticus]|uniref:methyltransferase domain-containing protein n=1 Tax=Oryzifoliimicrobium ureilyticus TaxID=3113724 RepID=UPI00307603A7